MASRLTVFLASAAMLFGATELAATPLIALRESENCGACHNEGRGQLPPWQRRCTLDCQGCHVDPAGAGPRNQWGTYYTHAELASLGFFKPEDPKNDTSFVDFHYDGRLIQWQATGGDSRTFPMSSEFAVRLRPFRRYLHLVYQNLLLGRIDDAMFRVIREGDRRFRERYAAMVDELPFNTYVRAYRGPPMYGIRRPNHTQWIRERLDLGPLATTEAVELGGTPNVPFFRVSRMTGDPYQPEPLRQKGTTAHFGLRGVSFGWHVNSSYWRTRSATHEIAMEAVGAGLQVARILIYGERNWRRVSDVPGDVSSQWPSLIHPSSTISEYTVAFTGIRGLNTGVMRETMAQERGDSARTSLFVDWHPIPFLQLELWRRFETGKRRLADTIGIVHLYADF